MKQSVKLTLLTPTQPN